MPKRKAKKITKQPAREAVAYESEVERQCAAIRTIGEVEIERLLTAARLLKSNMTTEQLQMPLLQFFEENLPNLMISRSENDGTIEVKWKVQDGDVSMNTVDGGNMMSSVLQHMSMAYHDFVGGYEFSSKSVKTGFIGADSLQMKDFVLEEQSDTHILGVEDSMQTPGVTSQRLSIGMTPKTLRLPKQGEMLLSVHGSPLGVYKENNMDAIHETEEE
uniref:uncharacterized protein LOC122603401 n=1 Tax=Erigeron canadensis TaxID=72917 RepID=UPI001CB8CA80|nr:uncharacterized protein LOC122603401 [Erigeron canadensis]